MLFLARLLAQLQQRALGRCARGFGVVCTRVAHRKRRATQKRRCLCERDYAQAAQSRAVARLRAHSRLFFANLGVIEQKSSSRSGSVFAPTSIADWPDAPRVSR